MIVVVGDEMTVGVDGDKSSVDLAAAVMTSVDAIYHMGLSNHDHRLLTSSSNASEQNSLTTESRLRVRRTSVYGPLSVCRCLYLSNNACQCIFFPYKKINGGCQILRDFLSRVNNIQRRIKYHA